MLRPGIYAVVELLDERGHSVFRLWLNELDVATRPRIQGRIVRFGVGNFGDSKLLGKGV